MHGERRCRLAVAFAKPMQRLLCTWAHGDDIQSQIFVRGNLRAILTQSRAVPTPRVSVTTSWEEISIFQSPTQESLAIHANVCDNTQCKIARK